MRGLGVSVDLDRRHDLVGDIERTDDEFNDVDDHVPGAERDVQLLSEFAGVSAESGQPHTGTFQRKGQ